jgi:hypothetical protein
MYVAADLGRAMPEFFIAMEIPASTARIRTLNLLWKAGSIHGWTPALSPSAPLASEARKTCDMTPAHCTGLLDGGTDHRFNVEDEDVRTRRAPMGILKASCRGSNKAAVLTRRRTEQGFFMVMSYGGVQHR